MSKNKSQTKRELKKDEIRLTRKKYNLALIGVILSVVFSAGSLWIANTTLNHQNIIEESNLQIGTPQSINYYGSGNNLSKSSIRIPLINGYYARYPTLILSTRGTLNGYPIELTEIPLTETNATQYPKNFKFVERGEPTFIEIIFDESLDFDASDDGMLNTIKQVTSMKNLKEGNNELIIEIHYLDFSKMITWTVNPTINFTFSDGKINPNVDLVYIERDEIKKINQN